MCVTDDLYYYTTLGGICGGWASSCTLLSRVVSSSSGAVFVKMVLLEYLMPIGHNGCQHKRSAKRWLKFRMVHALPIPYPYPIPSHPPAIYLWYVCVWCRVIIVFITSSFHVENVRWISIYWWSFIKSVILSDADAAMSRPYLFSVVTHRVGCLSECASRAIVVRLVHLEKFRGITTATVFSLNTRTV